MPLPNKRGQPSSQPLSSVIEFLKASQADRLRLIRAKPPKSIRPSVAGSGMLVIRGSGGVPVPQ